MSFALETVSFVQILLTHSRTTIDSSKRIYMGRQEFFSPWCEVGSPSRPVPWSPPTSQPWSWDRCRCQKLIHEGDVSDCQTEGFDSGESLFIGESGNLKTKNHLHLHHPLDQCMNNDVYRLVHWTRYPNVEQKGLWEFNDDDNSEDDCNTTTTTAIRTTTKMVYTL